MPDTAPVTPGDIEDVLPSVDMDECEEMSGVLLELPTKIWQIINWMMDSSGTVTRAFAKWMGILKPGDIIMSAAPLAEDSTRLLANGQTVSRETYADLFAVLNTMYGAGDGTTTFQLPDYRDRFPRAVGSDITIGETGGSDTIDIQPENLPQDGAMFDAGGITGIIVAASSGGTFDATAVGSTHKTVEWQGNGDVLDVQPKSIGAYFYIRT